MVLVCLLSSSTGLLSPEMSLSFLPMLRSVQRLPLFKFICTCEGRPIRGYYNEAALSKPSKHDHAVWRLLRSLAPRGQMTIDNYHMEVRNFDTQRPVCSWLRLAGTPPRKEMSLGGGAMKSGYDDSRRGWFGIYGSYTPCSSLSQLK